MPKPCDHCSICPARIEQSHEKVKLENLLMSLRRALMNAKGQTWQDVVLTPYEETVNEVISLLEGGKLTVEQRSLL